ncbi:hypothetical protein EDD15DRAFT_2193547 [Pisolithus albus]|nr:hypothetical protein EDD15DRAFT_2193547 [Pisolithus albus]
MTQGDTCALLGQAAHCSGVRYTKYVTVRPGNVGCQTREPHAAQNIACAGRLLAESHSGAAGNMRHQKQRYCVPLAWVSSSRVGNARRRGQEQCIASNMSNKAEVRIITNVPAFLRRNFAHNEWGRQDLEYLLQWGKETSAYRDSNPTYHGVVWGSAACRIYWIQPRWVLENRSAIGPYLLRVACRGKRWKEAKNGCWR